MDPIQTEHHIEPHTFILFGATGDLAKRKLYPALYRLFQRGLLPKAFALINVARSHYTSETFRNYIRSSIVECTADSLIDEKQFAAFSNHLYFCSIDVNQETDFTTLSTLVHSIEQQQHISNRLFYLAMAPDFFATVAFRLRDSGLSKAQGWQRVVIEKPFGHDYDSAEILNSQLRQVFAEEDIYRIDHYLGKEMVQNIEVIRFANSIFEPVWNNRNIESVQITSSEQVGVEERAQYYEHAGALSDMVQNHMLQMVMMIAMEPPSRLKTEAIRDEKVKLLRSLHRYDVDEVRQYVVRGQYVKGIISGQTVPGYTEEHHVAKTSTTETFIAAKLFIDNFRWAGVPFYIRTGKRMAVKATEIVIQFKNLPKYLYFNQDGRLEPNLLVIRINPGEGMYLRLNAKRPGEEGDIIPITMDFSHEGDQTQEAYERLLFDAMRGDSTFFTRWDEVSLAWKFTDSIAHAFATGTIPLHLYPAGTLGPSAADVLLAQEDYHWWPIQGQRNFIEEGE